MGFSAVIASFLILIPTFGWSRVCLKPATKLSSTPAQKRSIASITDIFQRYDISENVSVMTTQPMESSISLHIEESPLMSERSSYPVIDIKPDIEYQKIWGFGAAITDSCMANVDRLNAAQKNEFMTRMFDQKSGAGLNFLRLPVGSNDFSLSTYSLDDTPENKPDPTFKYFDAGKMQKLVDFTKQARKYNPGLQVMISPWSPPAWMKDTKSLTGGQLEKQYFAAYADYLIKVIQALQAQQVPVKQMSILNEPLLWDAHESWSYAQTFMNEADQKEFTEKFLIPRLEKLSSPPQILLHDHNWDNADDVLEQFSKTPISPLISGVAYHCYGGTMSSLKSSIHKQSRSLMALNTECSSTQRNDNTKGSFQWWMETQSVDAIRAGSSGALGWNLCLNEKGGPHLNGGCPDCRGLATIPSQPKSRLEFNAEYYALAQTSKYLQPGAVRIESSTPHLVAVANVAFKNPDGSKVLVIRNNSDKEVAIETQVDECSQGVARVPAGGAVTLRWP